MFEAGANYFILQVKPRLLIPMHYFHRREVIMEYARTASSRTTEVLAMPEYGSILKISVDESGYMDLSFPRRGEVYSKPSDASEETINESLSDDNPFNDSDLPLAQLAFSTEESSKDESSVDSGEGLKNKD